MSSVIVINAAVVFKDRISVIKYIILNASFFVFFKHMKTFLTLLWIQKLL